MGKQVQKDSATGPGSGEGQSWDSILGLLTLGLDDMKEMMSAGHFPGVCPLNATAVAVVIISKPSF